MSSRTVFLLQLAAAADNDDYFNLIFFLIIWDSHIMYPSPLPGRRVLGGLSPIPCGLPTEKKIKKTKQNKQN